MDSLTLKTLILSQTPPPTDQQLNAIFSDDLEYLLRAAPGSGKTWTACRRFIWHAVNWPYEVGGLALLSFTNVAVREFQDATSKLGQPHLFRDPNYLGTFNAFVERLILTPFGHLIGSAEAFCVVSSASTRRSEELQTAVLDRRWRYVDIGLHRNLDEMDHYGNQGWQVDASGFAAGC